MKKQIIIAFFVIALAACATAPSPTPTFSVMDASTEASFTEIPLPAVTLFPTQVPTSTETFFMPTPSPLPVTPSATPTVPSPYEADHRAIRKVIDAYFDKIYDKRQTYQVDGFGNTVSAGEEAAGFRKTELGRQALYITVARQNFNRYAYYDYYLEYSEIVYDSGQRARANFIETYSFLDDIFLSDGGMSQRNDIKHIMMLKNDSDGWRIIYDVHDSIGYNDSLYDPTPLPQSVLKNIDEQLIRADQAQGGPALPKPGKLFIPSDPAQLAKWKDYETILAEKLLPQYPRAKVLCEWELTEKLEQEINVWALCMTTNPASQISRYYFPAASLPAIIHLTADGTLQSVEVPAYGDEYMDDVKALFPNGMWKDLPPDVAAMEKHLHWRRTNPAEPPLVVLNATAILKVTPVATATP